MKICPKCHSSYSDETLNFCLTDGVPLITAEAVQGERLSMQQSWQEAETLHDKDFVLPPQHSTLGSSSGEHTTSPNSGSPTIASSGSYTTSFSSAPNASVVIPAQRRSNFILQAGIVVLLAVGAAIGIFWLHSGLTGKNTANNSQNSAVPSATVEVRKTAVALAPEQENQLKKEISETLETWRSTIEKRDIEGHIKNYVQILDNYYRESGIYREHVRADRQRAFDRYPIISLTIDNVIITPLSLESASVTFDKSWSFKNSQKMSTGSVQQEIEFVKQNGRWLINGEKDLKVYYINNRENETAGSSNSNSGNSNQQTSNTQSNK